MDRKAWEVIADTLQNGNESSKNSVLVQLRKMITVKEGPIAEVVTAGLIPLIVDCIDCSLRFVQSRIVTTSIAHTSTNQLEDTI